MTIQEPTMVVRIDVSLSNERQVVDEVVYYRADLKMSLALRWSWYFEYLAALVKVKHPKRKVNLIITRKPDELKLGDEYIAEKTKTLLKAKRGQINRLTKDSTTDLFGFADSDRQEKIGKIQSEIDALERGEFPYYYPVERKNVIKKWI